MVNVCLKTVITSWALPIFRSHQK